LVKGELWMVEPQERKLYDIYDVAVSLAANSANGDVTAELVDVGRGATPDDYAGKDVKGKIVLGSSGANVLQRMAVFQRGAVGVVAYNSLRGDDYPDQIPSSSVSTNAPEGVQPGFGWVASSRVGRELAARLAAGQKITLRSVIDARTFPGELETVHATIPGDGTTDQAVAVSAHLYEGYLKQGANDDNSGCALTLEMGRAYLRLINEGRLPRPKRTIHFLWVPEISGTNAWLDAHKDVEQKIIADLNFDMEALRLSASRSYWVLHRTPDTFPTFLNDVAQSMMEFVSELNRERIRYRSLGYGASWPVTAPNGSQDPFYIKIDKHYGASDHVTYMQHGIPSVMFITWPDMWYHSSQDTPERQDPTQYKRAASVGIGAMTVLASGGDTLAARVTAESLARGTERMGEAQRKGLGYMADVLKPADLAAAYKEAQIAVRHQATIEKAVVDTSAVLYDDPMAAKTTLAPIAALVDTRAKALLDEVQTYYRVQAKLRGVAPTDPAPTPLEREAAGVTVERSATPGQGRGGRGGGFGGSGGGPSAAIPQHMRAELNQLLARPRTALEIRDFLSGEFEPLPLDAFMGYVRAMEKSGALKVTPKE
jgi:aminopeptidase YwaD